MASDNAKIDQNDKPTLTAVTDDSNAYIKNLLVDPTTGRLKISAVVAGLGTIVLNEVVAGSGTSWTLAHTPTSAGIALFANGQRLTPTVDYTQVTTAVTTVLSWSAGTLIADYQY